MRATRQKLPAFGSRAAVLASLQARGRVLGLGLGVLGIGILELPAFGSRAAVLASLQVRGRVLGLGVGLGVGIR